MELYRAPFLYGEKSLSPAFEEWLSARRSEFLEQALEALLKLARSDAAADHHNGALERARRALTLDPLREDFHRQAMRSLAALGQRGNALRQYEVARRTLADELGVVPERETETLREEIARGAERDLSSRSTVDTPTPRGVVDENVKDLGVASVGERRRLLEAIAWPRDEVAPAGKGASRPGAAARGDADSSWRGGAERRQLTILLCDLVGSTALSAQLDPEDMLEIIGAYHRCCAEQITKAGGFVAKYLGAGVLGYFGYPQAHEDDAERSVQAGLALIETVPKLGLRNDPALQVRIGIASGLVVVGDLVGEGVAQEHGVVGDTPDRAARLQALAQPGQVVIAPSTRRLAGGLFEYRGLDRSNPKGLSEPIEAWQVLGPRAVESRFEAQHESPLTALVNREEEMELLLRQWRRAGTVHPSNARLVSCGMTRPAPSWTSSRRCSAPRRMTATSGSWRSCCPSRAGNFMRPSS
jgi:class 3 adenylate cyclase